MCRRATLIGNFSTILGFALLLSLVIPRCFVTVCIGICLVALGCFIGH